MTNYKSLNFLRNAVTVDPELVKVGDMFISNGRYLNDQGQIIKPASELGAIYDQIASLSPEDRLKLRRAYNDINRLTQYN